MGTRRWDLTAFVALALLVVLTAFGLRVYYRVTLVELTLVRIDPNGAHHVLPVPDVVWDSGQRSQAARRRPADMLRALEANIRAFMSTAPLAASAPSGARFEWRIQYSENTLRLDRDAVIVFGAGTGAQ